MPAEPRKSARKLSADDDIELKRARGEISCAECRRLKLKCDKKLPCGSCVRRGCTTICPNGSLSAGQGTRFILADTEQLHRKISEMSERIRQLEDVVAIFQAGISSERHPLLRDELLTIKFGPEVRRTVDEEHSRDILSSSIDALGTLTIGTHGETKYIGRSGGSETLFLVGTSEPESGSEEDDELQIDPELANISIAFPLAVVEEGIDSLIAKLEAQLPPQYRAWALCEAYVEHFTWWCRPLRRDELINDVLSPIYNAVKDPQKSYHPAFEDASRCPHLLAVLAEAEKYYRLGRAALSLRSVFDSPEIETVQAVTLMAAYHSLASQRYTLESAWTLISLATKLAQSIGLHRDSAQWGLDDKFVQRRRSLWWEIIVFEMIHCMALGRPTSVSQSHADCELPDDDEKATGGDGSELQGYWNFKMTFSREVFALIIDGMLQAKAPPYATILEMDRKIRQKNLPAVRLYLRPEEDDYNNPALCMKSYLMSHYRSITMIHIHRTFFAQALLDHPNNPLASPYAPSFLAANRCASVLIKSFIHHHERCPALCSRFWGMWTHAFSAAIILGSTVTRSPNATMAPSALMELDMAVKFFQKGAPSSIRARQAVPILRKLLERATESYAQFRNRHATPMTELKLDLVPEDKALADELAMFGGQTRVMAAKAVNRKRASRRSTEEPGVSPSRSASTPSDSEAISPRASEDTREVHPSVMEYLSLFPPNVTADSHAPASSVASGSMSATPLPDVMSQETMQFLNSFPINPLHEPPLEDPSSFFSVNTDMPMTMDLYSMSFMPGEMGVGDQWESLMRETGIFDYGENGVAGQTATSMTQHFDILQQHTHTTTQPQPQTGNAPFGHSNHHDSFSSQTSQGFPY